MVHHSKAPDITGQKFGLWTAIRHTGSMPYGGRAYLCRCECGTERVVSATSLRKGSTTNCGCAAVASLVRRSRKHGLYGSPIYMAWCRMKERCYYQKHPYYGYYGGKGIKVCSRWLDDPQAFYDDMASTWRKGLTLDRIDSSKDYSPDNCRWASRSTQSRNRSTTVMLTLNDETRSLPEWAERLGLPASTLRNRYYNGWSHNAILTTPYGQSPEI